MLKLWPYKMYRFQYETGIGKYYENRDFLDFLLHAKTVFSYCDGNKIFAHFPRTDYMKLSLSLPSEIFCIKPVLVACLYAVSNSGLLHTHEESQKRLHSHLIVSFLCLLI